MPGDETAWIVARQLDQPAGYLTGIGVVSLADAWSIGQLGTGVKPAMPTGR
jgi:hypothetical protein